jgi:hypothetical protein
VSVAAAAPHRRGDWPELPYAAWADTCTTLHLWTQIVGKIRLARTAWVNHSWHAVLYVTTRGLTTSPIPDGTRQFAIDFDFVDHRLLISVSDGTGTEMPLVPMSVADFHDRLMERLDGLGIRVGIHGSPNEVPDPIPFREDRIHAAYDADYANRYWRVLVQADRVFKGFRAGLPASAARCTSSGAAMTWPSPVSPGGWRRRTRGGFRTCRTR